MTSPYHTALCEAMSLVARDPRALVVGQAVRYEGTAMYHTLKHLPEEQRVEFPVAEDMQLGYCTGLALAGYLPVCVYPRVNFLLLAMSQLVLHLDKIPLYSDGGYRPKVIVRTAIGADRPLNPGEQHLGDYGAAIAQMLDTVPVVELGQASAIVPAYRAALERAGSTLLIERLELY